MFVIYYKSKYSSDVFYDSKFSEMEVLAVPPLFLQESGHSGGIPVESSGMEFSRKLC